MKIKVIFDFYNNFVVLDRIIESHIEFVKKLRELYTLDVIVFQDEIKLIERFGFGNTFHEIYMEENISDKDQFLKEYSDDSDWTLYFKSGIEKLYIDGKVICLPIDYHGDIHSFQNISFTEHAKNKQYYHELSKYYMQTLANDTEKEVDFLKKLFQKHCSSVPGKIMDCCCGVGRHSYLLAKSGFQVDALDYSEDQIKTAHKIHGHSNINYQVMDVRNIELEERQHDMSICMWTTYNYLSQDDDFVKFIESNYRHQRKGGILVLDSKNIPAQNSHRLYKRYSENNGVKIENLINKHVHDNYQNSAYLLFIQDNGENKFFAEEEFVRFYPLEEIRSLVSDYYDVIEVYGDFDMNSYDEERSNRFITVLKRK